jgi:hypothetical protein
LVLSKHPNSLELKGLGEKGQGLTAKDVYVIIGLFRLNEKKLLKNNKCFKTQALPLIRLKARIR